MPMIGEPPITGAEHPPHARQLRHEIQRPYPPDLPRQEHEGVGAAVEFILGGDHAHLMQQLIRRESQERRYPRVLQRRQSKASLFQRPPETSRKRNADSAIAVEKNPAAGRSPSLAISYF